MKVLVYLPGLEAEERQIPASSEALQDIVGELNEIINTGIPGIILIIKADGWIQGLPPCRRILFRTHSEILYGPVVACRVDDEMFLSIRPGDAIVLKLLLSNP